MRRRLLTGFCRRLPLWARSLGIVSSVIWPSLVLAESEPGTIETVTAPDGVYIAKFGDHESHAPISLAIGPLGRLYVSDHTVIYRMEHDGSATLVVGTPQTVREQWGNQLEEGVPALEARIAPGAMAFDEAGRLHFVDLINDRGARIARLEHDGRIVTFAGTGEAGFSGDGGPARAATFSFSLRGVRWNSLAFDRDGSLLVLDHGNRRIRKIDPQGKVTTLGHSASEDEDGDSIGGLAGELAVDQEGNLYFTTVSRVFRRRPDGTIERFAGSGERGFSGDGGAALDADLNIPTGLAVGRDGQVYISDYLNNRVRRVSTGGIISTIAGNGTLYTDLAACVAADKRAAGSGNRCLSALGDGGPAVDATIWWPNPLAVSPGGDLFVVMDRPDGLFWGGGDFSRIRRVFAADGLPPTAVTSPLPDRRPLDPTLLSVYPNPFNAAISISFEIQTDSEMDLTVYNSSGQVVRHLMADEHRAPDRYTMTWDGRDDSGFELASGSYLLVLKAGEERHTRKLTLVR